VETAGRLDGLGRILGDVFLVGRGDPDLSGRFAAGRITAAFEELADALRAAGVRRIEGRLVGQEGLFRGDRRGSDWSWEDLVWRYGAEVSALSFNDNVVTLLLSAGERPGDPVLVEASPASSYYRVVSSATTAPSATPNGLTLVREAGGNLIRLSGTFPQGQAPAELSVALEDPARYAATVFAEVLESRGIRVTGPVATSPDPLPSGLRVLATHLSPPLSDIVKGVNKTSQNLHAEMLLRLLGARVKGEGSVEAGQAAVFDFLQRSGVRTGSWSLQDASGLSRSDLVTAHGLVDLLAAMARHRYAAAFRDSLPVGGVDGTLGHRLETPAVQGRVSAKTGTLRNVNALAGYLSTRSGERLAFAIIVNHHTESGSAAVGAIDEITRTLAGR
jgi:serine-type D-Ala-D-Ala carboxypeptidase/endopeptidase (penicillin-binding protein 4)